MKNDSIKCYYCRAFEPAAVEILNSDFRDTYTSVLLHKDSLEMLMDDMDCTLTSIKIKYCPFCGRKL